MVHSRQILTICQQNIQANKLKLLAQKYVHINNTDCFKLRVTINQDYQIMIRYYFFIFHILGSPRFATRSNCIRSFILKLSWVSKFKQTNRKNHFWK